MFKKSLVWMLMLALFATLWGCGSNRSSGGDVSGDDTTLANAETVGITNCLTCHTLNDPKIDTWYMSSSHGNNNDRPDFNYFGNPASECGVCHNPLADGSRLTKAAVNDAAGNPVFNRPIVSCESCHGGGQFHNGQPSGIPFPKPTEDQCAGCHQEQHGMTVAVDYENSAHKHTLNSHVYADDAQTLVRARCSKCHSDEGARKYRKIAGDHDDLVTAFDGRPNLVEFSNVTCRTCHTPHQEEVPLLDADEVFTGSVQYNTCTNCHQLTYPAAHGTSPDAWMQDTYHAPPVNPYGAYGEIISDTHFDDPATNVGNTKVVEGYVVRNTEDDSCADCHNIHAADNTINNQWANSRHGGHILEAKEAAEAAAGDVFAAGSNDDGAGTPGYAAAWTHYNWDQTDDLVPGDRSGRAACQRCHTATGVSNYLTAPGTYDPANNDFSHLDSWAKTTGSGQNELLYCWACHSDAGQGELRLPGAISETYVDSTFSSVTVDYPNLRNANVCMACHIGREIGENISQSTRNFAGSVNFINSHYLPAGASLFGVSGYEYAGKNYEPVSFFAHDSIGTKYEIDTEGFNLVNTTNDMGPCVGCHLTSSNGHRFLPFEINAAGTAFEYITPVCAECHTGQFALTPAVIEEEETGYFAALEALAQELAVSKGIFFAPDYPYFFNDTNGNGILDPAEIDRTNGFTTWGDKDTMGAAFNYNLAEHDPGGFAHNRFYYKRLIWDSIDFLDGGAANSVPAAIAALQAAGKLTATEASHASDYLGTTRPGDASGTRAPIPGLTATVTP